MDIRKSLFFAGCVITMMLTPCAGAIAQTSDGFNLNELTPTDGNVTSMDVYSGDRNNVYFRGRLVKNADAMTFRDMGYGYGKDRMHVFFQGVMIPSADPRTFKIYGKANWNQTREEPASAQSEVMLPGTTMSDGYTKDNINVYYMGHKIEGATSTSFYALGNGYGRDVFSVYFMGQKLADAVASSFEILGDGYARDSFSAFYFGRKIADATASSFKYVGKDVAEDAFNKYFRGKKVEDDGK